MVKSSISTRGPKKNRGKSTGKALCIELGCGEYEKKFQIEEDARTLARYQEIMSDRGRKTAAMAEAKKQAAELQKKAEMLKKATR